MIVVEDGSGVTLLDAVDDSSSSYPPSIRINISYAERDMIDD
jgi:hypothetical protein